VTRVEQSDVDKAMRKDEKQNGTLSHIQLFDMANVKEFPGHYREYRRYKGVIGRTDR
jgi:hypothetical protein